MTAVDAAARPGCIIRASGHPSPLSRRRARWCFRYATGFVATSRAACFSSFGLFVCMFVLFFRFVLLRCFMAFVSHCLCVCLVIYVFVCSL